MKDFLKNKDGGIAIQFTIMLIPLLGIVGAGIDYSRISVVKTKLQTTIDQNVAGMDISNFKNRTAMEEHIVALAGVNLKSNNVKAKISIQQSGMNIEISDVVETPILGFVGKPKFIVAVSVNLKPKTFQTDRKLNNANLSQTFLNQPNELSRSQINAQRVVIRKRLNRIRKYKHLSPKTKQIMISRLRQELSRLNSL